jgi:hypothetical protein
MKQKIFLSTIAFGLLYGIITGLFSLQVLITEPDLALNSVKVALFPMLKPEPDFISGLPLLLMPYFFLFMLCGGVMRKDLARSGVFSFTRYQNRHVWYFSKTLMVALAGVIYPIMYLLGFSGIALLVGTSLDWMIAARLFAAYIMCAAPVYSLALLFCNLLSTRYGTHIAVVIAIATITLFILPAFLLWNHGTTVAIWLFRINPISGSVAAWRDMPHIGFEQSGAAAGNSLSLGAIIQLVQLACLLFSGWYFIHKMDILSETEEGK